MAIFLVQHGVSLPKNKDPGKGLSKTGVSDTVKIAQVAKMYQIPVLKIVHSGKKRAEQTARIFAEEFEGSLPCEQISGINPMDDVTEFGDKIDPKSNVMIVGHLPFMEKLVSYLATGDMGQKIYKCQNSGIVCLDHEEDYWFIKWTLNPDIS